MVALKRAPFDVYRVRLARSVAQWAHYGQVDKAGQPYIGHPARVAAQFPDDPEARIVAWLHDVVEDNPGIEHKTIFQLFGWQVWNAVIAISREPTERPEDYYARVRSVPLAHRVKLADINDNADPRRLALLAPELRDRLERKYAKARDLLGVV